MPFKDKNKYREYHANYYHEKLKNSSAYKEKSKKKYLQRYWSDPEKYRKKSRDWAKRNPEQVQLRKSAYEKKNPDKKRRWDENYRKKHQVKIRTYLKEWRLNNKQYIDEYKKKNRDRANYLRNKRLAEMASEEKEVWYQERYQTWVKKENLRRKSLSLPLVGEGYKAEMEMIVLVRRLFPNKKLVRHDRKVLGGLELDCWLPNLKIGFEYMGRQHYTCDGTIYNQTEEDLRYVQENDRRKRELCSELGIKLVAVRFDEKLSEQLLLSKLSVLSIKTVQKFF